MNLRKFAAEDTLFRAACAEAKVEPCRRQASKWRAGRGAAYAKRGVAQARLREPQAA
jgi:hypothetical protein